MQYNRLVKIMQTTSWGPKHYACLGILSVAGLLFALLSQFYYIGLINDDAAYALGAKSLLLGKYVALDQPGQPPLPVYPPGFPLFLAPFVALIGSHWQLLKPIPIAL